MDTLYHIGYYGIIAVAVVLGAFLVLIETALLPGYELRIVQSGSMEPALQTGGVVVIRSQTERYQIGDIITFGTDAANQLPTTHRIIGDTIQNGQLAYQTKGDANDAADANPVLASAIRGKVVFDIPYLGYLLDFARQPLGFLFLIVIPALFVLIEEGVALYQALRRKEGAPVTVMSADTDTKSL
jgi:signal peptidase